MTSTTSVSDKDATRSAAAEEPIEAVPGQLLPTCSNLDRLREKFLSAYDGASILESKELPWYCIHRDFYETGPGRAPTGPIPGNDFHTTDPRITSDPSAWAAALHFSPEHRTILAGTEVLEPLIMPFKHVKDCRDLDIDNSRLEETAALIRYLWPREKILASTRHLVGDLLTDTASPEYYIFHWLASRVSLGATVAVRNLARIPGGHFVSSQRRPAIITRAPRHVDAWKQGPPRAEVPTNIRLQGKPFSSAQCWSFAENGHTPISFDTIALILGLLTSPSKDDRPHHFNDPFADRDVSWILDSLHGFCRQKSPHQAESERSLFFTLGTSSDFWMHFHFVFHTYALEEDALGTDDDGSGMRISRSKFTVPISFGGTQNSLNFFERRTWIGMRVATKHNGRVPSASPSAIAVSVSDLGRTDLDMSPRLWEQRGLKTPEDAAGVALFQMALWSHLEKWENDWTRTLRHVEDAFEVRLSDQADMDRLNEVIAKDCHDSAATCSRLILVLMGFRNHIEAVVDSVNKMHDEWARTYSGRHTERLERFDVETQEAVLDNWAAVLVHVGDASARLSARIQRSIATLRTIREGLFGSLLTRF